MPIPKSVTPEDLKTWRDAYEEARDNDPVFKIAEAVSGKEKVASIYAAGLWLGRELKDIGCKNREAVAFALGQMSFHTDAWTAAQKLLNDYKAGIKIEPGVKLAEKLYHQDKMGYFSQSEN